MGRLALARAIVTRRAETIALGRLLRPRAGWLGETGRAGSGAKEEQGDRLGAQAGAAGQV